MLRYQQIALLLILIVFSGCTSKTKAYSHNDKNKGSKMNRLANEQSPYLLQHADNPVDWYPWGKDCLLYTSDAADE